MFYELGKYTYLNKSTTNSNDMLKWWNYSILDVLDIFGIQYLDYSRWILLNENWVILYNGDFFIYNPDRLILDLAFFLLRGFDYSESIPCYNIMNDKTRLEILEIKNKLQENL